MGEAAAKSSGVDPDFQPQTEQEFAQCLADPMWRLSNLYWITIKGDDGETELKIKFQPNRAQIKLIERFWYRNLILKARQLGMTTFVCILFLDYSLFGPGNTRAGIIAHTDDDAGTIFRDKVKFAYDNLPDELKAEFPLARDSARELLFGHNNSSIRVSTSMRSGTIHYLHVSEFGKICAKFPSRAKEVMTGSIPAVPMNGIIFIESTAEGREGDFFKMAKRSQAKWEQGTALTRKDYQFHFFPWFDEPHYTMDPMGVIVDDADHDYFDELEGKLDITLSMGQRAWYCATRDNDLNGDQARMWQEHPSTPDEAFQVSTEGCYFTKQLSKARQQKRILEHIPVIESVPCWTFWDIGNSDGTAIWVMQKVGQEFRLVDFYEEWGEPYSHAAQWLQSLGLTFDRHYLPHDADHYRQGKEANKSPRDMLVELLPGHNFEVVPRIEDVNWGIQQTRDVFPQLYFDETKCKNGLMHLENYRRKWNENQQTWSDQPDKTGGHSEAADALRQFGQAYAGGMINVSPSRRKKTPRSNWKTV